MSYSLQHSNFDVGASSLEPLRAAGRLKSVVVSNSVQLVALFEILNLTLQGQPALVLLENLTPVLIAAKPTSGPLSAAGGALPAVFVSLSRLLSTEVAIALWVTETGT